MTDPPVLPPVDPVEPEEAPGAAPPARRRFHRTRRGLRWIATVLAVAIAVGIVFGGTADLGPYLRARAERDASKYLGRTVTIGGLSLRLRNGTFVVEHLVIGGLSDADRPSLTAGRIEIAMPWWTILLRREILIESVEMTDWAMLVEMFENGRHSFPRFAPPPRKEPRGPSRFRTTVRRVRAHRGQFTYDDHIVPWSTVARNLDVTVVRDTEYHGEAVFNGGTVTIQGYEPMWANMRAAFRIEDGIVSLHKIDLETDGAESDVTGTVNLAKWREQTYHVKSRVHFPRMREIFFAKQTFALHGDADFTGTFRLFEGGRELKGHFTSPVAGPVAGMNALRFPNFKGDVLWLPDRMVVSNASSDFYGGRLDFSYALAPLGHKTPAVARLDATYADVDLATFTDFLETRGIRLAGLASGQTVLEYPLGRFASRRGSGSLAVRPPAGVRLMTRQAPADIAESLASLGPEPRPFDPRPTVGYTPIGGTLTYTFDPDSIEIGASSLATRRTYASFEGRTAWGGQAYLPFHVTSLDWQESDRLLAGLMSAFGANTRAIPIAGAGLFDGLLTGPFRAPRVEGRFVAERMHAWDVRWGQADGHVVVENAYATVTGLVMKEGDSEIRADGRFSIGFPRRDGGDEINAKISFRRRPVADLRHAFGLDDYNLDGDLTGEVQLAGRYTRPVGSGHLQIDRGSAYGESFDTATGGIRLEGESIRIDALEVKKGAGRMTGAAQIGWDGTYSFTANGSRIALETVNAAAYPRAPFTGVLGFSATGAGTFASPRYDATLSIADLFVADEELAKVVVGQIGVRNDLLTVQLEASGSRLIVSGSGRIALTPEADADLTFRFVDTSIDPYVRAVEPRLPSLTTAVASGTLTIVGELRNLDHLRADANVDSLRLNLFDYQVRNDGPIKIALDRMTANIESFRLAGDGTALELAGDIDLANEQMSVSASGDANLGILQGIPDLVATGNAKLTARMHGALRAPVFSGEASIANGRIRHFSLPHSVEAIDGRVTFDAGGIRFEDVAARLGGGDVRLGGRIGLVGYMPGEVNLTVVGERMQLRYPEGLRSLVDADLTVRGSVFQPTLAGTVQVRSAVWSKPLNAETNLFDFGVGGGTPLPPAGPGETRFPLTFDLRIIAPSTLRIENNVARIVASADLTLRGTYDRPLLFGRADIEKGVVNFEGRRYLVTRGTIDFANPVKIEPFFDVEAETRVRVPGETYRVTFHASGTRSHVVNPTLTSDPPLPTVEILQILFGDPRDPRNADLNALRRTNSAGQEMELLQARLARMAASSIFSGATRAVEQTLGVDTVQITPSLVGPSTQQSSRLTPTARLTIGKRISDRLYLTYSRGLAASSEDQIILIEFDQSDRVSWVFSQNEDRSYALDIRVRHIF